MFSSTYVSGVATDMRLLNHWWVNDHTPPSRRPVVAKSQMLVLSCFPIIPYLDLGLLRIGGKESVKNSLAQGEPVAFRLGRTCPSTCILTNWRPIPALGYTRYVNCFPSWTRGYSCIIRSVDVSQLITPNIPLTSSQRVTTNCCPPHLSLLQSYRLRFFTIGSY